MGITAEVLICLSFLELMNQDWELARPWIAIIGFGVGAAFLLLLDLISLHIHFEGQKIFINYGRLHIGSSAELQPGWHRLSRLPIIHSQNPRYHFHPSRKPYLE
jgi:hypothetical protein